MYGRPWRWAHRRSWRLRLAQSAIGAASLGLQFSSALCTKLLAEGIDCSAGGTVDGGFGGFRLTLARGNLTAYERIKIRIGFDALNLLKDSRGFHAHFAANLLIVLFRELAALIFEVEVLDVPEND